MKIGLLDHMGYGNLGDAATQEALITNIKRRLPDAELVGFSLNPDDTRKRHGIACYSITHWHPGLDRSAEAGLRVQSLEFRLKTILKKIPIISGIALRALYLIREAAHLARSFVVLRSLDTMIIAGGGQLGELWRGPWSHPYNVFKFSALTKLANRKLLFLNVGAGPLNTRLGKAFVKWAVYLADYVSLRDAESKALLQRLGVKSETRVFPDSAYVLDILDYKTVNAMPASKPLVGINPIGFCDPRIWPKPDESAYLRYLDTLTEFSLWLVSHGYNLVFFSGEVSVDTYAFTDLKQRLLQNSISASDVEAMFVSPSADVNDLLAEMSRFDFVVTSKFHGVIFSHLLAKPVIAISYHNKINDLMRSVGHDQHCLNIEIFTSKELSKAFTSLVETAHELQTLFRRTVYANSEKLTSQFDELFASANSHLHSDSLEAGREASRYIGSST